MTNTFGTMLAAREAYRLAGAGAPAADRRGRLWTSIVRFASSGIVIAGMGWFIVLAAGTFVFSIETPAQDGAAAQAILLGRLAEALIVTGFGFAILDALDRNRRLTSRAMSVLQRQPDAADRPERPLATGAQETQSVTAIGSGALSGREYTVFDDGSIEIETILGRRRFASILDAREFVADRS